ncbi:MAG: hypothetical protein IKR19_08985 [Acholeplasmatales bacterium]|nr:hypothetical protein [Acholeplasmatales bacterium]
MKFYIFAHNKDTSFTSSVVNDPIMADSDYTAVRERFDIINKEFKYNNTYLVADLNVAEMKQGMFTKPANINKDFIVNNDFLPFFVIGEFHYSNNQAFDKYFDEDGKFDPNRAIRDDAVYIKINGFTQQFTNNHYAMMSYINFVENSYAAKMYIKILVDIPSKKTMVELDRLIGNSSITKRDINNESFTKIELPRKMYDCYEKAEFPIRPAPKFFDLKDDREDLGNIHTSNERSIDTIFV